MTKRNPVSSQQNIFFNAEQVDDSDLTLEQQYNAAIQTGLINNHIGNGVIVDSLSQNIIFDSSEATGYLDGEPISAQLQPTDTNFGNQLEIELTDSQVAGKRSVKVCVIGLDFESNLQYETFTFYVNEIQVGKKHFTSILTILFNDFVGDPSFSLNLGGTLVIRETTPMTLSRDTLMVAQDIEPNLFFRDFYFSSAYASLQALLETALPYYDVDTLDIFAAAKEQLTLSVNDVITQIGEKFVATTNNIQKISLLLSVQNTITPADLAWTGDLVLSIYPLQSTIECPTDIAPNLAIDFSPSSIPIAQLSLDLSDFSAMGIVLDSVPQPVDFVFSTSSASTGNSLTPGNYYAFTLKRAGSANKCDILLDVGGARVENSRITTFTGTVWVDLPDETLWFKISTDAAKVSDGQAYDSGYGMILPKTDLNASTQATEDFCYDSIQFSGTDTFTAVVSAVTEKGTPVTDSRTGENVNSRQQIIPEIDLLNTIDVTNLESASEPLMIGSIADKNKKSFDLSTASIVANLHSATIAGKEVVLRVITDQDDARYDSSVVDLEYALLRGDLVDAKIIPNTTESSIYYRISEAKLCSMILGDVNGDGIIDDDDLTLLNTYTGFDLNNGLPLTTTMSTADGYTTFTNGYLTLSSSFITTISGLTFELVDGYNGYIIASGTDGYLTADPNDVRLASFSSGTVDFSSIIGTVVTIGTYKLIIKTTTLNANYGGFDVTSIDTLTDALTLRKIYLDGDSLSEMLRADIDGDFSITTNDGYLLGCYIDRVDSSLSPYTKIGTKFNVIRLKVQKFIDRADDYSAVTSGRSTYIHPEQDIFASDGYYASHDFLTYPSVITFEKQLTWEDYLVACSSQAKFVPCVFTDNTGKNVNSCSLEGTICNTYPVITEFDPGIVDLFVPNNVIIGEGGDLKKADGSFHKVDFEVATVVLEIPNSLVTAERTMDFYGDFVYSALNGDGTLSGVTRKGFPAMRFADCSYVTSDSLTNGQVRFSVSVQSFSPNLDGYSTDGYYGDIVDGKMGVYIDYSSGFITLNFTNLYENAAYLTLSTKIQVNVFLKKGGFNNTPLFVDSVKVENMLNLDAI